MTDQVLRVGERFDDARTGLMGMIGFTRHFYGAPSDGAVQMGIGQPEGASELMVVARFTCGCAYAFTADEVETMIASGEIALARLGPSSSGAAPATRGLLDGLRKLLAMMSDVPVGVLH